MQPVTRLRRLGSSGNMHPGAVDRVLGRARLPLDRAYERHALALRSLAELSTQVTDTLARRGEQRGAGPHVLVVSVRGWSVHNAYELLIAQALRLRGAQVTFLSCGGGMPICEQGWARHAHPRPCDRCAWLTDQVGATAGVRHLRLADLFPWGQDARMAPTDPMGEARVDPYEASAISAAWLLRATELELVPEAKEVTKDFAVAVAGVAHAADAILEEVAPDVVFLLNGLFGAERVIRDRARDRGIRAPTYEIAPRAGALVLSQDAAAPEYNVDELWEQVKDRPLSDSERSEAIALIANRARGVGAHESYYDKPEDDPAELRRRLGLTGRERVVSLFTNMTWDSATIGHDIGFASMFDWVEHAIRLAGSMDLVLVVRIHPAEMRWDTREKVQDVIVKRLGEVPRNVRFVPAAEPLSSYTLIDISDLLLTYSTTVGLEAAVRGGDVAVAGDTHYRGRGFTTDISGPDDLARAMGRPRPRPAAEIVEIATRYAHMFFFRAMIPFPLIEVQRGMVRRCPRTAAALAPGADRHLDWICERILHGGHFGLPDELAGPSAEGGDAVSACAS